MKAMTLSLPLCASLALASLVPPTAGRTAPRPATPPAHARPGHAAARPLSPLEKMARRHAARRAALARSTRQTADPKAEDADEEREHAGTAAAGATGGEDYMRRLRAYPSGIDPDAFQRAIRQRDRLRTANIGNAKSTRIKSHAILPSAQWAYIGPTNWYPTAQRAYYGFESMNGHIESIAVDPTNRLILYVASETGGVFKTTDGGVTWSPMSNNWSYLRTNTVTIDPKNPLTFYAGTGASPTGFGSAIGLMKTVDGGGTWTNIGADKDANGNALYFAGMNVTKVLVDPSASNIVTAFIGDAETSSGRIRSATANIWNSTDAGTTWSKKVPPFVAATGGAYTNFGSWDDAVATNDGTYLAAGRGPYYPQTEYCDLLYRSTDRGATWAQVANPPKAPADKTATTGVRLAASAVDAKTVYLVYGFKDRLALYKSTDGGATWTDITAASGINQAIPAGELDQVPYDFYLGCSSRSVNGAQTDVLYLGLKSVYQQVQTPGNTVWSNVGDAFSTQATIHSDQHCIAFDPTNPDRGWFGNDGGIYQFYSNPATGATNFLSLNDGLQTTQFYQTSYHPTNPDVMLGGTQDNGTAAGLGDLNSWAMVTGGDGCYTLINPQNPLTMYATYVNGVVYQTTDGFESRKTITPDLTANGVGSVAFVTPLAMDPTNPNLVYTAGQRLGRFDATTGAWTYFPTNLTAAPAQVSTLAVSPVAGTRIYVATSDGKLLTTGDGGTNWVTLKAGTAAETLPNKNVGAILPDPASANAVYIGMSGVGVNHLYYCADVTAAAPVWNSLNGAQTATVLPDAAVNTIAIDPADAKTLYVGTDVGVFQSADGGLNWANATAPLGLPNVQVNDLKAMPLQGYLYAGTWGRGIYRIRLRNTDPVAGVLFAPERVAGGQTIAGTVLLGANAPEDTTVTLTSSAPGAAAVPASVVIPAGQNVGTFTITTSTVTFTTVAQITASLPAGGPGSAKSGTVTVLTGTALPYLRGFASDQYGAAFSLGRDGSASIAATVTLSKAALSDITVTLTSSSGGATVPATVTVAKGQTSAPFTLQVNPVAAPETTRVTAQLGAFKRYITITRN